MRRRIVESAAQGPPRALRVLNEGPQQVMFAYVQSVFFCDSSVKTLQRDSQYLCVNEDVKKLHRESLHQSTPSWVCNSYQLVEEFITQYAIDNLAKINIRSSTRNDSYVSIIYKYTYKRNQSYKDVIETDSAEWTLSLLIRLRHLSTHS